VHTELGIPAAPEAIWAVLTDASGYEHWNPILVKAEGEYREGATMSSTTRRIRR